MPREWLLNLVMGTLVACALLVTGLVVRREFWGQPAPSQRAISQVAEWQDYASSGNRIGPIDAPVTIVKFSDFQCPACAASAEWLRELRTLYPTEVAVLYRHLPIRTHPHALNAARASECAAAAGRFVEYHDALFARQAAIGVADWAEFAITAGVADTAAFQACINDEMSLTAVERDVFAGSRLGVRRTPTLLINEKMVEGAVPLDVLAAYVEQALSAGAEGGRGIGGRGPQ